MKYKHLFFVWLLAEIFLGIGALFILLIQQNKTSDIGMLLLVFGYCILVSSPSLIAMFIFHYFYTKENLAINNYFSTYAILIIAINVVYAICSTFIFTMGREFNIYYIFTTSAGLLALWVVHQKIKRQQKNDLITN